MSPDLWLVVPFCMVLCGRVFWVGPFFSWIFRAWRPRLRHRTGSGGGSGPAPSSGGVHACNIEGRQGHARGGERGAAREAVPARRLRLPVSGLRSLLANIAWHGV